MQYPLECANCGRSTQTVETCTNLEYTCPWCYRTTIFNVHPGTGIKATLARDRDRSPDTLSGEARRRAFSKLMRDNKGVDARKC